MYSTVEQRLKDRDKGDQVVYTFQMSWQGVNNSHRQQKWEGKEKHTRKGEQILGMNLPAIPFKIPNERKCELRLSPEGDKPCHSSLTVCKNIQTKIT